jgi:hypothetical protein
LANLQPYFGKTPDEIDTILTLEYTKKADKVLYLNFDRIIAAIENELRDNGKKINDIKESDLRQSISDKLAEYMAELEASQPQLNFSQF